MGKAGTYITFRSESDVPVFDKRIPGDVKPRLIGRTIAIPFGNRVFQTTVGPGTFDIRFSLRTKDMKEARRLALACNEFLEKFFEQIRSQRIIELSHRQTYALAGIFYRAWAAEPDVMPPTVMAVSGLGLSCEPPASIEAETVRWLSIGRTAAQLAEEQSIGKLREIYGPVADGLLVVQGIVQVPTDIRDRLISGISKALPDALKVRARFALGDYSEDETLKRYPEWQPPEQDAIERLKMRRGRNVLSIERLVESWWDEGRAAKRVITTYNTYRRVMLRLAAFLGHDDARMVTTQDIIRYKEWRLAAVNSGRHVKAVTATSLKRGEIGPMKVVFGWAVENGLLANNPAAGVRIKLGKQIIVRERDFREDEAQAILRLANQQDKPMYRWVPWICAYTGCRVGEATQLRKQDIRKLDRPDAWVMTITPDAGTVKNKTAREVPLHPHLIEMGFADFLRAAPEGYLFLTIKEGATFRGVWNGAGNRLAELVRSVLKDPNVAPNHGWRHTFKSKGFEVGVQGEGAGCYLRPCAGFRGADIRQRNAQDQSGCYSHDAALRGR